MSDHDSNPAVLFTAFEPSGDIHAAAVIAELKRRRPNLRLCAWGGSNMERAGAEIIELLTSLAGKQTVIIATHDERIAGAADRVVYLSDGLVETEQTAALEAGQ